MTIIHNILSADTLRYITVSLLIFIFFLLLRGLFTKYLFQWLLRLTNRTSNHLDRQVLLAFEKPLRALFVLAGFYFALHYLPLTLNQDQLILKITRSAVVILVGWGFYDLAGTESVISNELKNKLKLDSILIPFFSKVIRFIIVALIILVVAEEWNYDVDGFIAGLGLGGLAFALAAKDLLANIFGGIVIIIEKPFSIGEWIKTPSTEGTVEDITFRSTKVRAFDQAVITVPNSTLANEPITNYTRMGKRRISFHLGIAYNTPVEKLQTCIKNIKQMLTDHPDIHPETVMVNFENFNESSLDVLIYCFTNTTNWDEHLAVRQNINFRIINILEEQGVSRAFPSRSIYLEKPISLKEGQ